MMERRQTKLYRVLHLRDGRCFDFERASAVADHIFVLGNFDLKMHPVYKAGKRWPLPKGDWLIELTAFAHMLEDF